MGKKKAKGNSPCLLTTLLDLKAKKAGMLHIAMKETYQIGQALYACVGRGIDPLLHSPLTSELQTEFL